MQREVYAEMGANQRRYLHVRAGEWFERNGAISSAGNLSRRRRQRSWVVNVCVA